MPSTYTLAEAREYVRSHLAAKNVKFYSDDEVKRALRSAYRDLCKDLKFYQVSATEAAVSGQAEYGWPDALFEIISVSYNTTYLERRSVDWLERRNPSWRNTTAGTPWAYYLVAQAKYGLYPKPNGTQNIVVYGFGVPTFPATDSTVFTLPDEHEDLLLSLAAAKVCLKDISGMGAEQYQFFLGEYHNGLKKAQDLIFAGEDTVVGEDSRQSNPFGIPPGANLSGIGGG